MEVTKDVFRFPDPEYTHKKVEVMSNHNDRTNALVDLVRKIQEKSATDEEFRALALKDASAALAQMGVDKPPFSGEIQFIESNERTQIKVALPPGIGGEFSDSDLEAVAGGKSNNVNCHASDSVCVSASHTGNAGGSNINPHCSGHGDTCLSTSHLG